MPWEAFTDHDCVDSGALIHIDRGNSEVPFQPGEEIRISNTESGHTVTVTVVSSTADRLELNDGKSFVSMKPSAAKRSNILDPEGKYFESWIAI